MSPYRFLEGKTKEKKPLWPHTNETDRMYNLSKKKKNEINSFYAWLKLNNVWFIAIWIYGKNQKGKYFVYKYLEFERRNRIIATSLSINGRLKKKKKWMNIYVGAAAAAATVHLCLWMIFGHYP